MLHEKYRPQAWSDVVGHDDVKHYVHRNAGRLGGKAFYITGPSGTGKSSIGYLLAGEVADSFNFEEEDAGLITPTQLKELHRKCCTYAIGSKRGRVIILNEVHGMKKESVRALLVLLEKENMREHLSWVLTTTLAGHQKLFDGIEADPLISRCVHFRLEAFRYLNEFAQRAMEIAEIEGLGGAEFSEYVELAKRCKANFRMMLSEIEAGVMIRDLVLA